ncbi:MAG: DNA polymerase IV [Bacillota bacterium]
MAIKTDLSIIHCDLDAFYAAVEQRDNPALRGRPVIVGGRPDSRGVVATCSYEARAYGVKSAMPLSQARRLCPEAVFLPVNMKRYGQASRQVFEIFSRFTPDIEPLSIDEAFLDVTGSLSIFGSAERIAWDIKKAVLEEVGLIISTGISYNKFLAKLATDLGKPNGMKIIRREEATAVLSPLPVSRLWGVGSKTRQILKRMGIETIGDLALTPPEVLDKHLGQAGTFFWELAHGIDNRRVEKEREVKSIGREITFDKDLDDQHRLKEYLLQFSHLLGRRLHRAGMEARTVTIKVRYHDYKTVNRSKTLSGYTANSTLLYETALSLLSKLDQGRGSVRLIGLSVSNLRSFAGLEQGSLFVDDSAFRSEELVDRINDRFGENTLIRANLLPARKK